ncbi:hypothetical protein BDP27DRAFT_1495133 [Rhodocollybia butyracea]|uniref:Uncharacterized protein n=1 Tax=Rhodocollybia butyracea TaxID=206335 RepID=A0A9P5PC87_9AGAR|nr:hypothetical protein BDP27DRAFT_1495133 [Rhodocollybia butyracea]
MIGQTSCFWSLMYIANQEAWQREEKDKLCKACKARPTLGIPCTKNTIRDRMKAAGITSTKVFYDWLVEEGKYLWGLCTTPPKHGVQMSVQALDQTNSLETKCRHEEENEEKLIPDIQALESKVEIQKHWVEGGEKWNAAKKSVKEGAYWKALDSLEKLLIAQMFEMARPNISGTGELPLGYPGSGNHIPNWPLILGELSKTLHCLVPVFSRFSRFPISLLIITPIPYIPDVPHTAYIFNISTHTAGKDRGS